jgi:hypothetical protein
MAVEVRDVRKVVVIEWDLDIVEGKTASVQADGKELRVVPNRGYTNVFYPLDYTGSTDFEVHGSKAGVDSGTIEVTGEESGGGGDGGPEIPPETPEIPNGGGDIMLPGTTAQQVFYNDGSDPNVYALMLQDNGDQTFNLYTFPPEGVSGPINAVPQREPEDYGEDGGGHTWHLERI